jgi:hypothetical protein
MPRERRVQLEGAIDHLMSRGNARRDIVADERGRRRFLDRLGYRRPGCLAGILRRLDSLRARGGEVDRDLDAIRDRLRLPGDAR